jgi:predicted DNA-binding protein YlxM (UPF0122 family)
LKSEWQVIEEICSKICNDSSLLPDLIQEISLVWLELDGEKKRLIQENKAFPFYISKVISNQWNSSTSTFYTKYRKETGREYTVDLAGEEYDSGLDGMTELMREWIDGLFPSDQNIIRSYFFQNLTIMQISAKYDVDKNFIWNTIQRVLKSLKRRAQWHHKCPFRSDLLEMLSPLAEKPRLKIEERQLVIDVHNHLYETPFNNPYDKQKCLALLQKCLLILKR